jgi:hypothetical protein
MIALLVAIQLVQPVDARNNAPVSGLLNRTKLLAGAWFLAIAIVVLGPLLLSGYLLLLDFPGGPHIPWVSLFPLPSQAFVSAGAPVISVLRVFTFVLSEQTPKLLIVAGIVVAGVGLFRFLTSCLRLGSIPALTGATMFAINPFVYDRILAGQLLVFLAYALLPWALPSLWRLALGGTPRALIWSVSWAAVIGIVNVQIGIVAFLLVLAAIVAAPRSLLLKIGFVAAASATLLLVDLYWLLPLAVSTTPHAVGAGDLTVYATRPRSASVLGHVLLLQGFWRTEFSTPLRSYPLIFLLTFVPLLAVAGAGVIAATASAEYHLPAMGLALAALIALVLSMGTSFPPTAPISRFLFTYLPGYGLFREPQKWLTVVALAYGIFAAVGLDALAQALARRPPYGLRLLVLAPLLPLVASHIMFWGFQGRVGTSNFPAGWTRAEASIAGQPGNLLFLPWHLYEPLPFTQDRIVANPAPSYFTIPTLVSTNAGLGKKDATAPTDARTGYVNELVHHPRLMKHFGHLMAPLGVHYIALAHVADAHSYRFLNRQDDLRRIFNTKTLSLYRNTAFRGSLYSLNPSRIASTAHEIITSPSRQQRVSDSLVTTSNREFRAGIGGPTWTRQLSLWRRFSAPRNYYVGTDLSCRDGWRLGDSAPFCNLGTLAAFSPTGKGAVLWRPGFGTQLIGLLISVMALLALAIGCWFARPGET